jgi:hypothetical protein
MKNIWITSLAHDQERVQKTMTMLQTYALDANGHFWEDDLKKMAWIGPREQLINTDTALWLLLSNDKDLASPSVRYGLSMLALCVQSARSHGFPVMLVHEGQIPAAGTLPTPFQGAEILAADNPALGAKIVAAANTPPKKVSTDYRLDVYAMPQLGQWFEVGPVDTVWEGAMFGVCGAEIDAHGAGPAGQLPQKAVLEYPMQGLKMTFGETEYTAWAVKNRLESYSSYFLRVKDEPESVLFGPFPEEDDADVYVLRLK